MVSSFRTTKGYKKSDAFSKPFGVVCGKKVLMKLSKLILSG